MWVTVPAIDIVLSLLSPDSRSTIPMPTEPMLMK
jgi:hypothetical protein